MIIGITGKAGSGKNAVSSIICDMFPDFQEKSWARKVKEVVSILTGIPVSEMDKQEVKNSILPSEWDYFTVTYSHGFNVYAKEPDFESEEAALASLPLGSYAEEVKRNGMTVRAMLQRVGTDAIRDNFHKNAWVNGLMREYNGTHDLLFEKGSHKHECSLCQIDFKASKDCNICKHCVNFVNSFKQHFLQVDAISTRRSDKITYPNWVIPDTRFPNEVEAIKSRNGIIVRVVRPDNPYPQSYHESETALDNVQFITIINDGSLDQLKQKVADTFGQFIKKNESDRSYRPITVPGREDDNPFGRPVRSPEPIQRVHRHRGHFRRAVAGSKVERRDTELLLGG